MSYMCNIEFEIEKEQLDALYKKGQIEVGEIDFDQNSPLIVTAGAGSALAFYRDGKITLAKKTDSKVQGITPKDARQKLFLSTLYDEKVLLSVAIGRAGTGKTLMSVAYALERYFKSGRSMTIYLIKPSVFVGGKSEMMGPIPGDVTEKLQPVMASYLVHFKKLLDIDAHLFISEMMDNEKLVYLPIELARGMSLENAIVIVDEAQNLDVHSLKTLISRVGSGSKLILLGDLGQVDIKLHRSETGLYKLLDSEAFGNCLHTSAIELKTQYRSPLADLAEDWQDELESTSYFGGGEG